ncbi:hypothetical protein KQI58_20385 [Enterococcus raffinosus]|uniref:hypothetical protein n=1 Tax=Enterococcus raffinosus TaxID=71452 RepID=UPI001C1246A4|nr:hypothetical protein [Enterococcus raffinosus]MBU5363384.1 hypothetical protein [Enterococcus raffinosus]
MENSSCFNQASCCCSLIILCLFMIWLLGFKAGLLAIVVLFVAAALNHFSDKL